MSVPPIIYVWGPALTKENKEDLERTQKTFAKLVLREKYINYESALTILNIDTLESRRNDLCLKFAQKGIENGKLSDLFPENDKKHLMKTRIDDKYRVNFANTDKLRNSSIITMQNMLNSNEKKK